ncbi:MULTISPECIES: hypothetical protein [unclassified Streptomyces]|uniref:hypothetical protein n=1 Tax=unclassified Streptomyces TaxID=2593676 RepID=UPI0033D4296F
MTMVASSRSPGAEGTDPAVLQGEDPVGGREAVRLRMLGARAVTGRWPDRASAGRDDQIAHDGGGVVEAPGAEGTDPAARQGEDPVGGREAVRLRMLGARAVTGRWPDRASAGRDDQIAHDGGGVVEVRAAEGTDPVGGRETVRLRLRGARAVKNSPPDPASADRGNQVDQDGRDTVEAPGTEATDPAARQGKDPVGGRETVRLRLRGARAVTGGAA